MEFLKKYGLLLGIIFVLGMFVMSGINTIPRMDEDVKAKWSQVENQYQRRADLIPNIVNTVKGYATHEKLTLTEVVEARANATKVTLSADNLTDPEAVKKFEAAQGAVSTTLSRLLAVAENYPNLKADQQFIALQSQLEGTENRIAVARKDYIDTVQNFNTRVRTFPGFIWAAIYGAKPKAVFSAAAGSEKAPEVNFDSK
ncbi:MAG: LemA family protein [Alphaproteobacteria bacterium]|nr:MAG: LemA family protein [Alphaproteobacteria bacterium]